MSSVVRNTTCKNCFTFPNSFTACCYHNPQSRPCMSTVYVLCACSKRKNQGHEMPQAHRRAATPGPAALAAQMALKDPLNWRGGLCWFGIKDYGNLFPQSHREDNEVTKTPLNKESKIWLHANYRVGRAFVLHKPKLSIYCLPCFCAFL